MFNPCSVTHMLHICNSTTTFTQPFPCTCVFLYIHSHIFSSPTPPFLQLLSFPAYYTLSASAHSNCEQQHANDAEPVFHDIPSSLSLSAGVGVLCLHGGQHLLQGWNTWKGRAVPPSDCAESQCTSRPAFKVKVVLTFLWSAVRHLVMLSGLL